MNGDQRPILWIVAAVVVGILAVKLLATLI